MRGGAIDILEKHAGTHDGIVFQLECGQVNPALWKKQQIVKGRALARKRRARIGPVELREQRLRIEDVLRRSRGPLAFDEAHQEQLVEIAVARRLCVEQLNAARAGSRRKGLSFDPAPNHGGDLDERSRRVVELLMRAAEAVDRGNDGAAGAQVAFPQRVAGRRHAIVRGKKRQQRGDVYRWLLYFGERP